MKPAAIRKLRSLLAADQPVVGLWVTLESPSLTEIGVALGLDWDCHRRRTWASRLERNRRAHPRGRAQRDGHPGPLGRIQQRTDRSEARSGSRRRDDPLGSNRPDSCARWWSSRVFRRKGKARHGRQRASGWGECITDHADQANELVLVVPVIESVEGGRNIQSLIEVPGVDLFFWPGRLLIDRRPPRTVGRARRRRRIAANQRCNPAPPENIAEYSGTSDEDLHDANSRASACWAWVATPVCCCAVCTARWPAWGEINR